jgi:REP element-mobilizing transposase RayT
LGIGQPQGVARALSLPEVVHRFKTLTTKRYADGVKRLGWPPFPKTLWQRNYYEHIIRDEHDLTRIREYIVNNPLQWALDRENPANAGQQPGEP